MDNPEKLATLETQETSRRQAKPKTQHDMCLTPPYTRYKTKTNKAKNTIRYVFATTILKIQDENKQHKETTQYVLETTVLKQTQIM